MRFDFQAAIRAVNFWFNEGSLEMDLGVGNILSRVSRSSIGELAMPGRTIRGAATAAYPAIL